MRSMHQQAARPFRAFTRLSIIGFLFVLAAATPEARAQSAKFIGGPSKTADPCRLQEIPFTVRDGLVLVRVTINEKPSTFVVDTAGMTMINSDHVTLPLVRQIRTGVVTVSSTEALDLWNIVRVKSFLVGTADLHDSNLLSRSFRPLENQLGVEIGGLLGQDALRLWASVSFDYKRKVLVLQDMTCAGPGMESILRLQRDALPTGR
jgi:hypothetical protein